MKPIDFIARLEASGYSLEKRSHCTMNGNDGSIAILDDKGAAIVDVETLEPGEQWEVFGWIVKELERRDWQRITLSFGSPGRVSLIMSHREKLSDHPNGGPLTYVGEYEDAATLAAMSALAAVLEEK